MRNFEHEKNILKELEKFDTPSITNVVSTYPKDTKGCIGLYHPWYGKWYTNQTLKCMYPELGRRAGYVVTVTYGLPDPDFNRLTMVDLYRALEQSPKPIVLCIKQNIPENLKKKNGLCGGNMMTSFKSLNVTAVISDGPSRDLDEIRPMGMQYMLTGVCAGHGYFSIQEINTPVDICDMVVTKGDIVHMDENGAMKFPPEYMDEVLEKCEVLQAYEVKKQALLAQNTNPEILASIMEDNYQ